MSDIIRRLVKGRGLAWGDLKPVFDTAIVLAKEAEYQASKTCVEYATGIDPAYPPIVLLLAESVAP